MSDESAAEAVWELQLLLIAALQFYCPFFSKRQSLSCVLQCTNYTNTLLLLIKSTAIFQEKLFSSFFAMTIICVSFRRLFFSRSNKNFFSVFLFRVEVNHNSLRVFILIVLMLYSLQSLRTSISMLKCISF